MIKANIKIGLALAATIGLVSLESAKAQGNLVVNGTFDSDLSGWTAYNCLWMGTQGNPLGCVSIGGYPDDPATLSQTINDLIVGNIYIVSGDYFGGSPYDGLGVFINGNLYLTEAGTGFPLNWFTLSFSFIASSPTATLEFMAPVGSGKTAYYLDNISMVAVVPEPSSLCLLGLGVAGGLFFFSRRKKSSALLV